MKIKLILIVLAGLLISGCWDFKNAKNDEVLNPPVAVGEIQKEEEREKKGRIDYALEICDGMPCRGGLFAQHIVSLLEIKSPTGLPEFKYEICLDDFGSWADALKSALKYFSSQPNDSSLEETIVYGLLQTKDQPVTIYPDGIIARTEFRKTFQSIFRSSKLMQIVYNWAMPYVKAVWSKFPPKQKALYLSIFKYGETYLQTFDFAKEKAYWDRLAAGECEDDNRRWTVDSYYTDLATPEFSIGECTFNFTKYRSDGKERKYGKLEAFFFRRAVKGMTREQMLGWVQKIIKELEST